MNFHQKDGFGVASWQTVYQQKALTSFTLF